jgi:hypothetical protein
MAEDATINFDIKNNIGAMNTGLAATGGLMSGIAGGISGVVGGMALFGAESKNAEKTLIKVQSAMALNQGVKSVVNAGKAVSDFTSLLLKQRKVLKLIVITQKLWNAAMKANPIVLLVSAIAAVVAGIAGLVHWFKSSSAQAKANTAEVKANSKALKEQAKALDASTEAFARGQKQRLAMAKASGESAKAIRELELTLINEKLAFIKSNRAIALNTIEQQRNTREKLKARGAEKELIEEQQDLINISIKNHNAINQAFKKALGEKKDINNKHLVEIQVAETSAKDKAIAENKTALDKQLQDEKDFNTKRIEELQAYYDEAQSIAADRAIEMQLSEAELLDAANERQNSERENERNAIYEKYFEVIEAKKAAGESIVELEEIERAEILAVNNKFDAQEKKAADNLADKLKKADEATKKSKQDNVKAIGSAIGNLGGMMEEGSAAAKATALTEIAINTGVGMVQGLDLAQKSAAAAGPGAIYAFPLFYAAQVIAVLSAAAQAKTILGAGGGGGSGGGAAAAAAAPSTPAPQMMSGSFELGGGIEPEPVKAFVVTDEMTNSQNQLANIRRRATI